MAKNKSLTLNINPEEIVGSEIVKSGEYRYASVGIKRGENEYMRISYEWKGEGVPEFVMGLMSWMQANEEDVKKGKEEKPEEYEALKKRIKERS